MTFKNLAAGAALAALLSTAAAGTAGAVVITNGTISVGVSEYGQLYDGSGVGLLRNSDGVDVMAAYGQRDSWGVSGDYPPDLTGIYADDGFYGLSGVTAGVFNSTADSAVANITTLGGFSVTQSFSFVAPTILAVDIDLTNVSGGALSAIFQRLAEFHVDLSGEAPLVEYQTNPYSTGVQTSIAGFDDPSTASEWNFPCCVAEAVDGGAGFRLDLGTLAAGATRSFTFYYGLGDAGLASQLNAAGATDVLIVANQDGSLTGGMGVALRGAVAVPEPATWAMMILGFFGLGGVLRRRRSVGADGQAPAAATN